MATIARNLGVRGRRQRLLIGVACFAVAVIGAVTLAAIGLPRGARLILFVPFYLGAMYVLQYRDHT